MLRYPDRFFKYTDRLRSWPRSSSGDRAARMLRQQGREALTIEGAADEISLNGVASLGYGEVELRACFNALYRRRHTQARSHRDDRADDGSALLIVRNLTHERLVDLDLVERKFAQVTERGVSGTEIVHRDPDAKTTQLLEDLKRAHLIVQQHTFGNLEL